jgi:hypothetical protein
LATTAIELQWTVMDVTGRPAHGLQNRLKGAVEVSLVSSILIHPRQLALRVTAKMTAKRMDVTSRQSCVSIAGTTTTSARVGAAIYDRRRPAAIV